ncbi:phosphate ABC transporter permease [Escherichia coli]|uniref:Phosphate ABC transporter permease n=1 Tax=Escherichia coli TaxID=562 RepID=A0A376WAS9_ECOLX|nr:phosphate ABC transporter permease [Escherichia coli]
MAMVEMQTTAALAESRRKMQARRRLKNRIALTLSMGDDGLRSVLADLDFNVHHHSRYRWYVAGRCSPK